MDDEIGECGILLERHVGDSAAMRCDLTRDETDAFAMRTEILTELPDLPSASDVAAMIPQGSAWSGLVGFRSFGGRTLNSVAGSWYVLYARTVLRHPERGGYPVQTSFVLTPEPERVASTLGSLIQDLAKPAPVALGHVRRSGFAIVTCDQPLQYAPTEAAVLTGAFELTRTVGLVHFESLAFGDDDIPATPYHINRFAVGVLEPHRRRLNALSRLAIKLGRSR